MTDLRHRYTVEDVAEMFNVNPETVRRWCREGKIECIKLPGARSKFRFSEQDIQDFIAKGDREAVADERANRGK